MKRSPTSVFFKRPILLAFLSLALITTAAGASFWNWWHQSTRPLQATTTNEPSAASPTSVQFQVPDGASAAAIGEDLENAGLIRSSRAWSLWSRWLMLQDKAGGFQAGTYQLSAAQPLQAIAQTIWAGDVVQTSFTIPEGWSIRQMAAYLESEGFFQAEEFLAAAKQVPVTTYPWLPAGLPHLEGFLYPDTYQLPSEQITPQAVVDIMLKRFEQVALPLYQKGQGQTPLSLLEWVTLASIVEKEAVIPAERPTIAGVFFQRLQKSIALGADPTVEYGLGITQTPDQPLTLAQVNTPSAYNTYLNPGLPPTPISSPGLASLEAALTPEPTEYLYFVARYDGTHVFSRTLAEHETAQASIRDRQDASR